MGSDLTSETDLLQASLAGSKEAFGTIVGRYQSLICGITYSTTGDFSKSEELAQETFVRAWRELRQLRDLGRFRAWLCMIARNAARKSIRRQDTDVVDGAMRLEETEAIESAEPGPVEHAISKEQETVVWQALREVPETYREPLVLFYRQQQSVRQVAAELELSEDVVKQRLSRGRKLLKAELASVVEEVIGKTRPGKVFTVAVIAALPAVTTEAATAAVAGATAKAAPTAKAAFAGGLIGAVLGPILGLVGGLFGTWMSVRHTRSTREKRLMVKFGLLVWAELILLFLIIGLLGLLAAKGIVPVWMFWTVFAIGMTAHVVLLVPAVIWVNRRQRQIRKEDGTYVEPQYQPVRMPKANVYGAFGGSVFGPVCWIIPTSFIARDWLAAAVVLIVACSIFLISTDICIRDQRKYWPIVIGDMIALCALNLVIVNLRWNSWMELYRRRSYYDPGIDLPLWAMNLLIGFVFGLLLIVFVVKSRKRGRLVKEESKRVAAE